MSDPTSPPLANSPEARTETGELLNQSPTPSPTSSETPTTSAGNTEPQTDAPKPDIPETYQFKTTSGDAPDEKLVAAATPIFRELGLTQAQADKLVDLYNTHAGARADDAQAVIQAQGQKWDADLRADKIMGSQLPTIQADVGRMIDQLPQETRQPFREAMTLTMAGNNPAIVRAIWEMSKLVNEGRHVTAPGPAPVTAPGKSSRPSMAESMYPNLARAS